MNNKVIHYCWFGGNPLPESALKCIESWKNNLPDYEIKEWNESNFDVNIIPYTAAAYKARKFAFVSDYARFWILYKYGGLYFDTDVEVIRSLDSIIGNGPYLGCETDACKPHITVNAGLGMYAEPGMPLYEKIIKKYESLTFQTGKGSVKQPTVVSIVTPLLMQEGLKEIAGIQKCGGVTVYPKEYFCPMDYTTGVVNTTDNSYTIHHFAATWLPWYEVMETKFWTMLKQPNHYFLRRLCLKFGIS